MPPRAIAHEMPVHGHVMHSPERAALNATPLPQADGARHRRGGDDAQHRQLAGQGRRRCIGASRCGDWHATLWFAFGLCVVSALLVAPRFWLLRHVESAR